jgi:hypothetical protein
VRALFGRKRKPLPSRGARRGRCGRTSFYLSTIIFHLSHSVPHHSLSGPMTMTIGHGETRLPLPNVTTSGCRRLAESGSGNNMRSALRFLASSSNSSKERGIVWLMETSRYSPLTCHDKQRSSASAVLANASSVDCQPDSLPPCTSRTFQRDGDNPARMGPN